MSTLKQVNSPSNFASFFIVMIHISSVNFKLILFLLWIKGFHQSPNFDTFKCSGENLPYSSSPDHKSVFFQILHYPAVSWKITPLYFFRSNITYFAQTKQMKVQILETCKCSGQIPPNSCHFWNNKSVFLQILHQSSRSWSITPLYLSAKILYLVKFYVSSVKSETWHFDGLLLCKPCTVSAKQVQRSLSWHWRVIHSLKKNSLLFVKWHGKFDKF